MILFKDAIKLLQRGVAGKLNDFGFKAQSDASSYSFRREVAGATQIFYLLYSKEPGAVKVEPVIAIKVHDIENIYHKVAVKSPEYFDSTSCLRNNLFKIGNYLTTNSMIDTDEKKSFLIEEENDITILSKVIPERFEEMALPYFNANSSVKRVDELLNSHVRELSVHKGIYPLRASIGIIAAKLNNNPEYQNLVEIYESKLQDAAKDYKQEFMQLKELLKDY
jgi:hypothetical protein